jgi:hypothetical protein
MDYKKGAKVCAILWTIIYLIALPVVAIMAFAGFSLTLRYPLGFGELLAMTWFVAAPLSLLLSIVLMWVGYAKGHYRLTRFIWTLPYLLLVAAGAILLGNLLVDLIRTY